MFVLTKRKDTKLSNNIVDADDKKQEIATVQVRDIKEYLVDEYKRSQDLLRTNEYLKSQLQVAEEIKLKYDAALVTLDEYKNRIDKHDRAMKSKDSELLQSQMDKNALRDELNDYKIRFSRASITKEEIREEVIKEVKEQIIKDIMEHKGNLSKSKVVEIINESRLPIEC